MPLDWWLHLRRISFADTAAFSKVDAEMVVVGAALIALGFVYLH